MRCRCSLSTIFIAFYILLPPIYIFPRFKLFLFSNFTIVNMKCSCKRILLSICLLLLLSIYVCTVILLQTLFKLSIDTIFYTPTVCTSPAIKRCNCKKIIGFTTLIPQFSFRKCVNLLSLSFSSTHRVSFSNTSIYTLIHCKE